MISFLSILNDLPVEPSTTLLLRHQPTEREFRRKLPWLAAEDMEAYNAYQQTQSRAVENQMLKATHVASFIGHTTGQALFVGIFEKHGEQRMTAAQKNAQPGMKSIAHYFTLRESFWFDLRLTNLLAEWKGRLTLNWPGERSWSRWGTSKSNLVVQAIHEESVLAGEMPSWDQLILTWSDLHDMPGSWKERLSQWRGVYFIHDRSDGKGYVGSAYGTENILGRWNIYAKTGHGNNKLLRDRRPDDLSFSILQLVAPDLSADDVIRLEGTWKNRLHTRESGLNEN
jgi:hypothetical protein